MDDVVKRRRRRRMDIDCVGDAWRLALPCVSLACCIDCVVFDVIVMNRIRFLRLCYTPAEACAIAAAAAAEDDCALLLLGCLIESGAGR